jgi:hypothetical protein
MKTTYRNILAIIIGLIIGSGVNMGLILISGFVIPPPEGADVSSMEALKATLHLFEARHFIFPFLAHGLGSLVGAYVAAQLAANHKMKFALSIGGFFLIGGIINIINLPSPVWFSAVDLIGAYIPMAWIGGKLARA